MELIKSWKDRISTNKCLVLTVGLPRSGKTTWALKQGYPIVNRDAIRLALHGQPFIPAAEDMVTALESYMVKSLFLAGHNEVIVDAMHLKVKYLGRWVELARVNDWQIYLKIFFADVAQCKKRAMNDGREDLIPVIEKNAQNYESIFGLEDAGWQTL